MATPRPRHRKRRISGRGAGWLVVAILAGWPAVALLAGYETSWPMAIGTAVAAGTGVWLLDHHKPRRHSQRITTLPKLKTPMAERLAKQAKPGGVIKPLLPKSEPELPTPRTRLKAKLAAAQEFAVLYGFGEELQATWKAMDLADAETADVVTQREIEEYPLLDPQQKLEGWLRDHPEKREAS
jgi:hypothetical protein